MNTDLSMGGHNINNAGAITATGNVATSADVSSRNVTVTGTVTAATANVTGETYTGGWFRTRGDTGWYSEKWGGGIYQSDADWVRIYNNKGLATGGSLVGGNVVSFGNMTASGRIQTNEFVYFNGRATAGTACSPNGLEGSDASGSGAAVRCKNGIWQKEGGFSATTVSTCISAVGTFDASCIASCPAGTTITGGGCNADVGGNGGSWEVTYSAPNGNGWACKGGEDYGTTVYYKQVTGYAMCAY